VFDISHGEFRDGPPEDLVSLSTGVQFETKPGEPELRSWTFSRRSSERAL
jgi:hypothetical protein